MQSVPSISGMNDEPTEMLPVMTSDVLDTMEHEQVENERASFLTTGLMNILDREKLKAQYEVEAKVPEVTGRNEFLTTGLISILERGKSTELELPKNHSVQTEDIPIGDGWPGGIDHQHVAAQVKGLGAGLVVALVARQIRFVTADLEIVLRVGGEAS